MPVGFDVGFVVALVDGGSVTPAPGEVDGVGAADVGGGAGLRHLRDQPEPQLRLALDGLDQAGLRVAGDLDDDVVVALRW